MRAPWAPKAKRGEWRHVPPEAWGRMVPSLRERRGWRNVGPLFPG
jgi:hypothetical protein